MYGQVGLFGVCNVLADVRSLTTPNPSYKQQPFNTRWRTHTHTPQPLTMSLARVRGAAAARDLGSVFAAMAQSAANV